MSDTLYDAIRAILLLGMALLAWREFRRIRADIDARKRRDRERDRDESSQS